jgi:hypothetical protein
MTATPQDAEFPLEVGFPPAPWPQLPQDARHSIRMFAFFLGNGTVDNTLLEGFDYRPQIMQLGSDLERIFAIFTNVLEVGPSGDILNADQATHRAAQWIRSSLDPTYIVEPPFEDWEYELP